MTVGELILTLSRFRVDREVLVDMIGIPGIGDVYGANIYEVDSYPDTGDVVTLIADAP